MLPDGGLVSPVEETEPIGDFAILNGIGDVDEEPADKRHHRDGGHNLISPLEDLDMAPNRNALVAQPCQHQAHETIRFQLASTIMGADLARGSG